MEAQKIVIGIVAHVDAGKTTLSERILYNTGSIRKIGRVDHGNAFLDTDQIERSRGITIFSKQAEFSLGANDIVLLDTPGHVDFSAEMERTLQVLDYAVLVINGSDGIQSHTMTLWNLLTYYQVPVFVFVNKMDQAGTDRTWLLREIQSRLDDRCIDFGKPESHIIYDALAMCSEKLMEFYLETETIDKEEIAREIVERNVFPCFFGSALKGEGIDYFLKGLEQYFCCPEYPNEFGAKVFKISRDLQGNRLTHMKITGGRLKVKDLLEHKLEENQESKWQEKADQIRIYSGEHFITDQEVSAGAVCSVLGLSKTRPGEGLGLEPDFFKPVLEPVLTYRINLPPDCDVHQMLIKLRLLEEEQPQLHISTNDQNNEIHVQVMGEIEIEILKTIILERFHTAVEFDSGSIVYKETIAAPVIGIGHFEPLKHYAEVHLLMEPGEPGSGLQFTSRCSESVLAPNWQNLVLVHLAEKKHPGILTGSEITDMTITLVAGKAHLKHTVGGDFREATYRAVRQGLKQAKSILLEPTYEFRLELPSEFTGRALNDLQRMKGQFAAPKTEKQTTVIEGSAPVSAMRDYQSQVLSYTKGEGRLFCFLKGYQPCENTESVLEARNYDWKKDIANPASSIFCSQGAGYIVEWDHVKQYSHADSGLKINQNNRIVKRKSVWDSNPNVSEAKELEEIFVRTYGSQKTRPMNEKKKIKFKEHLEPAILSHKTVLKQNNEQFLLVDGYNIVFAWEELKETAETNIDGAREKLIEILSNYQGYKGNTVIVVFDAYKVAGGKGSVTRQDNIYVIFTKEAETADQYIERAVNKMGKSHDVTVATSDGMVQMIVWGEGAFRLSAQGLKEEIDVVNREIRAKLTQRV